MVNYFELSWSYKIECFVRKPGRRPDRKISESRKKKYM